MNSDDDVRSFLTRSLQARASPAVDDDEVILKDVLVRTRHLPQSPPLRMTHAALREMLFGSVAALSVVGIGIVLALTLPAHADRAGASMPAPSSLGSPIAVTGSAQVTEAPTPGATEAPADAVELRSGDYAVTVKDGVVIRPTTDRSSAPLDVLPSDELLYVSDVRRDRSGSLWYRVEYTYGRWEATFGWLESERSPAGFRPYRHEVPCPTSPRRVVDIAGSEQAWFLDCFGDRPITLTPAIAQREELEAPSYTGTPGWLATHSSLWIYGAAGPDGDAAALPVHVAPGVELPTGRWMTVHGQFDHPDAALCQRRPAVPGYPQESAEEQALWCRQQFVVTAVESAPPPSQPPG